MATTHVPHAVTREERFHAGNPGTPNRLNEIEGARGETMGLDKKTGSAMHDTPVSSKGRQMPDRDIISKAGEVARELQTQGNGEGFPKGGAMDDR